MKGRKQEPTLKGESPASETTVRVEYVVCHADLRGKGWPRLEVKRFRPTDDADAERNAGEYARSYNPRAKAFAVRQVITVEETVLAATDPLAGAPVPASDRSRSYPQDVAPQSLTEPT